MARQDQKLAETRSFLDRLWTNYEGVFDPDLQCAYADRVRRRQPGDKTLGLSPHMDAGTVERWIDPGYQRVYERVFAGDWRGYDPVRRARTAWRRARSPRPPLLGVPHLPGLDGADPAGPGGRHARLIPIAEGISYVLLRALQEDVPRTIFAARRPGRALGVKPEWHADMMAAQVSIPEVMPGDTVWWHTDICHAVADEHAGKEYASVIYIGSAPDCAEEPRLPAGQKEAFLAGRSPPDFAPMDFEVDFKGRATGATT